MTCPCLFLCLLSPFGTVKMLRFSTLRIVSDSKLGLVGYLRKSKLKLPRTFKNNREIQKPKGWVEKLVYLSLNHRFCSF